MNDTIRTTVRLPGEVYKILKAESQKTGNPISSIIRSAINNYLNGVKNG